MTTECCAPPAAPADALEEVAYRYGRTYDSYLALDAGRETFWSADGRGAVSFQRLGKYLHSSGGLLAPDEHKSDLLAELLAMTAARRWSPTFYNIVEADLPLFREYGFQITKWGEEALVDLPEQNWEGKAFEWVRRQTNYCQRQGLVFCEFEHVQLARHQRNAVLDQLADLAPAPLERKPQAGEIGFLEGAFDPGRLARRRVFLARRTDAPERVEGFLVANPGAGGDLWVFETYRHRESAPRGCATFLMHQAIEQLRAEGVPCVSLCLVPGLGCTRPMPGDSRLARYALGFAGRYGNFIFDTAGLYHFKSRFRPRFESRYLCAYPRLTLGSATTFVRLLGVLDCEPRKLARLALERLRKARSRATLAQSS